MDLTTCVQTAEYPVDMTDIKGLEHVKRAAEVAAAGSHGLSLVGSPGTGKTMVAQALLSILPPLTLAEALAITRRSIEQAALPDDIVLVQERPWVAPHPTLSRTEWQRQVQLSHLGVLVLEHLQTFRNERLSEGDVMLRRQCITTMLVTTQNPCPCGWHGDAERQCTCSPAQVDRYQKKVSIPLLDRIDIHTDVQRINYEKLSSDRLGEPSAVIRERVIAARQRQAERFRGTRCITNADIGPAEIRHHCQLDSAGQSLMKAAMRQLQLSARGYHRVLKLARTIADLAGSVAIGPAHLAEAVQYRPRRVE